MKPHSRRWTRGSALLVTLWKARSYVGARMWRDGVRRARASQAFELSESGVIGGTTANSVPAGCRGPRQDGQAAKAKPLTRGCLQTWIRAWGQHEPAWEGTGRLNGLARRPGWLKGGLGIPATHTEYSSLRGEHPIRTLTRRVRVTRWASGNGSFHIAGSFDKTRCSWFFSSSNEVFATAPFPLGMVGRFPEAPISCSSRKAGLSDGYGPCSTTSGPRLLMGRCPSSTGAHHGS
jgi:hypothetical protein